MKPENELALTRTQLFQKAMEQTSSHGLPRMVTNRPIYVRMAWLLVFLFMTGLFLKGFVTFAQKFQSQPVTTSLEVNTVRFQFPDIYACFENPVAASYASTIENTFVDAINRGLQFADQTVSDHAARQAVDVTQFRYRNNFAYPQSLPYNLLIDTLAHKTYQAVIASNVTFSGDNGYPSINTATPTEFYSPILFRCLKWSMDAETQKKILRSPESSGLFVTLLIDSNYPPMSVHSNPVTKLFLPDGTYSTVYDWSMSIWDRFTTDRRSGVRIILTPPGEYPSDFSTWFTLSPGRYHTVEMSMTQQEYKVGQFACLSDPSSVQFVNPYDQSLYNHSYSYSYCFYYEYHSRVQTLLNVSGFVSPLPWPLKNRKYLLNLTGDPPSYLSLDLSVLSNVTDQVIEACESQRRCSTVDYSASISSAQWPKQTSLDTFVGNMIYPVMRSAQARNKTVPALTYLTENFASAASYLSNNMLKVHFKPRRVMCDQVSFSKDYDLQAFIADIGGIVGVYLGWSLMTLCELLEFFYDIAATLKFKKKSDNLVCPKAEDDEAHPPLEKSDEQTNC